MSKLVNYFEYRDIIARSTPCIVFFEDSEDPSSEKVVSIMEEMCQKYPNVLCYKVKWEKIKNVQLFYRSRKRSDVYSFSKNQITSIVSAFSEEDLDNLFKTVYNHSVDKFKSALNKIIKRERGIVVSIKHKKFKIENPAYIINSDDDSIQPCNKSSTENLITSKNPVKISDLKTDELRNTKDHQPQQKLVNFKESSRNSPQNSYNTLNPYNNTNIIDSFNMCSENVQNNQIYCNQMNSFKQEYTPMFNQQIDIKNDINTHDYNTMKKSPSIFYQGNSNDTHSLFCKKNFNPLDSPQSNLKLDSFQITTELPTTKNYFGPFYIEYDSKISPIFSDSSHNSNMSLNNCKNIPDNGINTRKRQYNETNSFSQNNEHYLPEELPNKKEILQNSQIFPNYSQKPVLPLNLDNHIFDIGMASNNTSPIKFSSYLEGIIPQKPKSPQNIQTFHNQQIHNPNKLPKSEYCHNVRPKSISPIRNRKCMTPNKGIVPNTYQCNASSNYNTNFKIGNNISSYYMQNHHSPINTNRNTSHDCYNPNFLQNDQNLLIRNDCVYNHTSKSPPIQKKYINYDMKRNDSGNIGISTIQQYGGVNEQKSSRSHIENPEQTSLNSFKGNQSTDQAARSNQIPQRLNTKLENTNSYDFFI